MVISEPRKEVEQAAGIMGEQHSGPSYATPLSSLGALGKLLSIPGPQFVFFKMRESEGSSELQRLVRRGA